MAAGMRLGAALVCLPVLAGMAHAQELRDPTQPPSTAASATAASATGQSADGQVLQSILLSKGRRVATISGRVYRAGDRVGRARLVSISPGEVALAEGGRIRVLKLMPESVGKGAHDAGSRPRVRAKTPDRSGEKG